MLIGSMASPFCTPLSLKIHQGLIHVNDGDSSEESRETLGSRIVQMALNFAMKPEKLDGWMERLQQYMTNAGYSGSGPEKGLDHNQDRIYNVSQ